MLHKQCVLASVTCLLWLPAIFNSVPTHGLVSAQFPHRPTTESGSACRSSLVRRACGDYRWRCSHCAHALDLESLRRQMRGPLCCFGRISLLATLLIKLWISRWSDGGMAGGGASWGDGFVYIYARIGDRATPAADFESSCCFLCLLLVIR